MAGPIILEHSACATLSSRRKAVPIKVFLVALFVAVPVATFVGVSDAQLPPGSVKTVGTAHSHSVTRIPLSQMATCTTPTPTPTATVGGIGPARPGPKSDPGQNLLSGPIVSFEGLHHGELNDGNFCSCPTCPSDDSGAVSFDYYVQTVNYAIIVYDKSGNVLAGPVSGTTFWENHPDLGPNGEVRSVRVRGQQHRQSAVRVLQRLPEDQCVFRRLLRHCGPQQDL